MTEAIISISAQEAAARITARTLSKEIYAELAEYGCCTRIINGKTFYFEYDDIRAVEIWERNTFYDSVTSIEDIRYMIEEELLYGV